MLNREKAAKRLDLDFLENTNDVRYSEPLTPKSSSQRNFGIFERYWESNSFWRKTMIFPRNLGFLSRNSAVRRKKL